MRRDITAFEVLVLVMLSMLILTNVWSAYELRSHEDRLDALEYEAGEFRMDDTLTNGEIYMLGNELRDRMDQLERR